MNCLASLPTSSPSNCRLISRKAFGRLGRRSAMTLVEMLVATALTLIMMALVAQLFGMLGKGVNGSRNRVELYNRLRATGYRLKQDLAGVTVELTPPIDPESGKGYFEYIEGKETDSVAWGANGLGSYVLNASFDKSNQTTQAAPDGNLSSYIALLGSDDRLVGDVDDVLLFTTRSADAPFAGKLDNGIIESPVTEVVWFCQVVPNTFNPRRYNLFRRQRIVMGNPAKGSGTFSMDAKNAALSTNGQNRVNALNVSAIINASPETQQLLRWQELEKLTDISCRLEGNYFVPNTLGDLTKRQNRFCHDEDKDNNDANDPDPYVFNPASGHLHFTSDSGRYGEDLILSNCIGFDVRVFDDTEGAVVKSVGLGLDDDGNPISEPHKLVSSSDPGFFDISDVARITTKFLGSTVPVYVDLGIAKVNGNGFLYNPSNAQLVWPTYDTWSTTDSYDDIPYNEKVRGLEIRIRCYEPASRAVIQLTVRESFD